MNMPSILRWVVAIFFLAVLPAEALTPEQVFDKVKDSVVVIKTLDAQGDIKGQGSGVVISAGKVATNCHVVEGGVSYQVGSGKTFVRATLYAEDADRDICILDAGGIAGKPAQIGKAANLKVGGAVYAVGAPRGLELSLSDGIVAQLRGGPPPFIQTTAAISPGSSGGGLFDAEGRLVGLTTLYIKGGQNLNFAMPVEWIAEVKAGRKPAGKDISKTEWVKRALALEKLQDWKGLLDWFKKWTKSEPNDVLAWFGLGTAYGLLKRYNDAIDAYRQTIRINPKYADAWTGLGFTYGLLKRYNDAIDAYRQAIRINPKYADAWINLGVAYNDLGRYNDAIDAYRQVIRINPEQASAWFGLGTAYGLLKRYNDAIDAYRQTIRINPEYADAWFNLGVIYHYSGNQTAALDAVQELRRLNPEKADELFDMIVPR